MNRCTAAKRGSVSCSPWARKATPTGVVTLVSLGKYDKLGGLRGNWRICLK
jgi:hypothetical protein